MKDAESNRGVTSQISYLISLGIVLTLLTGVSITLFSILDGASNEITSGQLEEVGYTVAGDIETIDRLQRASDDPNPTRIIEIPEQINGESYSLSIVNATDVANPGGADVPRAEQCGTGKCVVVYSTEGPSEVTVPLVTVNDLASTQLTSDGGQVRWDATQNKIRILPANEQ